MQMSAHLVKHLVLSYMPTPCVPLEAGSVNTFSEGPGGGLGGKRRNNLPCRAACWPTVCTVVLSLLRHAVCSHGDSLQPAAGGEDAHPALGSRKSRKNKEGVQQRMQVTSQPSSLGALMTSWELGLRTADCYHRGWACVLWGHRSVWSSISGFCALDASSPHALS